MAFGALADLAFFWVALLFLPSLLGWGRMGLVFSFSVIRHEDCTAYAGTNRHLACIYILLTQITRVIARHSLILDLIAGFSGSGSGLDRGGSKARSLSFSYIFLEENLNTLSHRLLRYPDNLFPVIMHVSLGPPPNEHPCPIDELTRVT